MEIPDELQGKLQITGTLVFKDKDGNVVKTIDMKVEVPAEPQPERYYDNQRSE